MTREEYKQEYLKLSHQMDLEYDEYIKRGIYIGLDGSPINKKYKKLKRKLFEKYQREKED